MTVAELIEVLQNYDQDAEVLVSNGMNRYHVEYETISELDLDSNLEPVLWEGEVPTENYVVLGEDY